MKLVSSPSIAGEKAGGGVAPTTEQQERRAYKLARAVAEPYPSWNWEARKAATKASEASSLNQTDPVNCLVSGTGGLPGAWFALRYQARRRRLDHAPASAARGRTVSAAVEPCWLR